MPAGEHLFWKKDDIGITRALAPLSDQQAIRAEKTLDAAEKEIRAFHKK
jgi:hypothetical protein